MHFKARDVSEDWSPLTADELQVGEVYFSLGFADRSFQVPCIDTLVLVEVVDKKGVKVFLFQLATAFFSGIGYDEVDEFGVPMLYEYDENSLKSIFDFDKTLEQFLVCALRRGSEE